MNSELKKRDTYIHFHRYSFDRAEEESMLETLRSGWITRGPKTATFEKNMAEYLGNTGQVLGTNSCTASLHLALLALKIGAGDEVIVPSLTFSATANVCEHVGAKPVFADVNPEDLTIDPKSVIAKITSATKAIIPVHYSGFSCDMEALRAIADEHNLYLIEDAAHAVETRYHDKPVGYYSDFTCFSFYATKNITSGEGGALLVRDPDLYRRAQVLSLHGMSRDAWKRYEGGASPYYDVAEPGFKYNMFDLQAALLIPQLAKVEKFLESRTALVAAYEARLKNHPLLTILQARDNSRPAHHLMPVLIDFTKLQITREELNQLLHQWNIGVSLHFIPVHLMSYYRNKYGCKEGDLPVTESAFDQLVSLPLCPSMTEQDVDYVCEVLIKILGENS